MLRICSLILSMMELATPIQQEVVLDWKIWEAGRSTISNLNLIDPRLKNDLIGKIVKYLILGDWPKASKVKVFEEIVASVTLLTMAKYFNKKTLVRHHRRYTHFGFADDISIVWYLQFNPKNTIAESFGNCNYFGTRKDGSSRGYTKRKDITSLCR